MGAIQAWEGRPPVGVKLVVQAQGPNGAALTRHLQTNPELSAADAVVIADVGNLRQERPMLITAEEETARGSRADTPGAAYQAATVALGEAWGRAPSVRASGDSSPLLAALRSALPAAEILMLGPTSGCGELATEDQSALFDNLEKTVIAEAKFFREFAVRARQSGLTARDPQ